MIRLSGRFRSALIIGVQGIRARKLRTFLSMVSLFLGVLAVVTVQAGAEIAKRATLADIEMSEGRDGTRHMYLPSNGAVVPVILETLRGRSDGVASLSTNAIIGEPGVTPVNPGAAPFTDEGSARSAYSSGRLECDDSGACRAVPDDESSAPRGMAIEVSLTALTGDIRRFRPYRSVSGRWLDFDGEPSLAPRLVLNKQAAKGFASYLVPAEMRMTGATANTTPRIIGVIDDGRYEPTAYVRTDEMLAWLPPEQLTGERGPGTEIMLSPQAHALEQVLRSRLVGAGMSAGQIHVETVRALERAASELAILRMIFLGMASLVLLIGVAGVLNVGLATVGERIEEFALRRAVGTSRLLLAGIVLAETLLTGLFTAAAAIGTGVLGLSVIGRVFQGHEQLLHDVTFPWQAGAAGVIAGLVAGLLGGLIPALRAARIPIATVMRA